MTVPHSYPDIFLTAIASYQVSSLHPDSLKGFSTRGHQNDSLKTKSDEISPLLKTLWWFPALTRPCKLKGSLLFHFVPLSTLLHGLQPGQSPCSSSSRHVFLSSVYSLFPLPEIWIIHSTPSSLCSNIAFSVKPSLISLLNTATLLSLLCILSQPLFLLYYFLKQFSAPYIICHLSLCPHTTIQVA